MKNQYLTRVITAICTLAMLLNVAAPALAVVDVADVPVLEVSAPELSIEAIAPVAAEPAAAPVAKLQDETAPKAKISVESVDLKCKHDDISKDVEVKLSIADNPGITACLLKVSFAEGLTLKAITLGDAFTSPEFEFTQPGQFDGTNGTFTAAVPVTGSVNLFWDREDKVRDVSNGVLATLTFAVPTANEQSYAVSVTADAENIYEGSNADNSVLNNVEVEFENGGISVDPHTYEVIGTTPPTCTQTGETRFECACSAQKAEPIPAREHVFTNYIPNNDATCKDDGTKTATCDREDCDNINNTDTVTDVDSHLNVAHTPVYAADGAVITETCEKCDTHSVTATVSADAAPYTGAAIETASVAYSDQENWMGGNLVPAYTNNVNAGTEAKASITVGEVTAEVTFEITKADFETVKATIYEFENTQQAMNDSKDVTIKTVDESATFDSVEYEVPLSDEELESAPEGETTKWTSVRPEAAGTYKVRAKLTGSSNVNLPEGEDVYITGELTITPHQFDWDNGTEITPPTCTVPGVMLYKCMDENCTEETTKPIDPRGHIFTNYIPNNDATCKDDGTKTATCDREDCDNINNTDTVTDVDSHLNVAHTPVYAADGAVITETCEKCDTHSVTATVSADTAPYTGAAIETASVAYSDQESWMGGDLVPAYTNNVKAGTEAKASITVGEVTAEVTFEITKADFEAVKAIYTFENLDQKANNLKDVTPKTVDESATFDSVEYEVPLTDEELESAPEGETTKWTSDRPDVVGTYNVRAKLTGSSNVNLPEGDTYITGELTISLATGGYYPPASPMPSIPPIVEEHEHTLTHVAAKEATDTAEGNVEYWHCADCGKYFTDAAAGNETTMDKLVLPKTGATDPEQPTPGAVKFDDVKDGDWFNEAVHYVAEKGLMTGTATTKFSPVANTTRAMLMTILARLAGVDTNGGATWYEKGLEWAKQNGISDGTNPEANITREQLVTMLYRYAKATAASAELKFTDADQVSAWALDAMKWAVANGIVNGMSNNELQPTGLATRAQMAAILMRYTKLIEK